MQVFQERPHRNLTDIMKLRIKFKKYGPVRFIGHLDVMRFFQKANRRAELDVAYTGGFSPHQIMSFAAPLGVGLTSNGEYMDLEVHSLTSCENVKTRLNAASVPGIEITSVKILPDKAGNAMASVAAAGYTVTFREGRGPHFDLAPAVERFLKKDEILITKETKKGSREINLKEGIYELKAVDGNSLYLLVDASSAGNIKPIQVVEALFAENGDPLPENALMVNREETYYQVNAEAAEEVARQLRLRNLSGIIIVDFINMAEKENRQKLLDYLKTLTAGDPMHPRIVDMTPLGLVEITRKKSHPTLAEQWKKI